MITAVKENKMPVAAKKPENFFDNKSPAFFQPLLIQPKPTIGPVDDPYEREADSIADKVMRMSDKETLKARPSPITFQRKCADCEDEEKLQMKGGSGAVGGGTAPSIVQDVINSPGHPLDVYTRSFMESRFGQDFGNVQVHNDDRANRSSMDINAAAYTYKNHLVFAPGKYQPNTNPGQKLLAHELTHVIQQNGHKGKTDYLPVNSDIIQRDTFRSPSVSIRSPVFEETVTQLTEFENARALSKSEVELATPIFGKSIDYSRVRIVTSGFLEYRTVANSIRVGKNFNVADRDMAKKFIHEMTHVWQYQHGGTAYMSVALQTQVSASRKKGNAIFAYDYKIQQGQTFFDFTPEQQAFMVANYFLMLRDKVIISTKPKEIVLSASAETYSSNHLDERGARTIMDQWERLDEINTELPLHEPLMQQMREALPQKEKDILKIRQSEVMETQRHDMPLVNRDQQLLPIKPLLEITF
jgi:hypothetical protein